MFTVNPTNGYKTWKIGDLGVSTNKEFKEEYTIVGAMLYQSPEMRAGQIYTEKTDVFSLGLTFLEIICPLLLDQGEKDKVFRQINKSITQSDIHEIVKSYCHQNEEYLINEKILELVSNMLIINQNERCSINNVWEELSKFK